MKELHINAQVVAFPPTNLRQLFMQTRIYDIKCNLYTYCISLNKNGLCQVKGCVYRINCDECNGFNMGETIQHLYLRYVQHLGDMRHPRDNDHGQNTLKYIIMELYLKLVLKY